ncbi:calcium/sodium antiporter [Fodinicurvata sp. EGI_FJ10296]|uniref:calcium/sodium antiporter n=1 Tax=Fodinicurvata sp. EGI_FJ10296 TaxID=3231908 RepID=UPI003453A1C4
MIALATVLLGLVVVIFGADILVRGSVDLARRVGMSPLVIGMTIVAIGTSLPELVVSVDASLKGSPGLAVGNIVGSNIANVLLIIGVAGLLYPMECPRIALYRDGFFMLGASILFVGVGMTGPYGFYYGIVALAILAVYLIACPWFDAKRGRENPLVAEAADTGGFKSVPMALLAIVGGLVGVVGGANLLVSGAITLARVAGVSEEVIGLTMIAFGTSVPELATTVAAALRRQTAVALGNVLGSNIFNILGVMGVVSLVAPTGLPPQIAGFDIWIMLAASVVLLPFLATGWRINRWEAAIFFVAYLAFLGAQAVGPTIVMDQVGTYWASLASAVLP